MVVKCSDATSSVFVDDDSVPLWERSYHSYRLISSHLIASELTSLSDDDDDDDDEWIRTARHK